MTVEEEVYCDYLYDCYIANQRLTDEDWELYGKEDHHLEIPDCEGGVLSPLNSQPLTRYQHWIAGVLQSEVNGRKCFAMIPKGVLPHPLEKLRVKWDSKQLTREHQVMAGKCVPVEHLRVIGKIGGSKNKGKPGRKRTAKEKEWCKELGLRKPTQETLQKMRENCFKIDGWFWITNGTEERMVPPESEFTEEWKRGRLNSSEETRKLKSLANSGENNPMYGVTPKTKSMRWYKDLSQVREKMFIPGEEPDGWVKGRLTARDRR